MLDGDCAEKFKCDHDLEPARTVGGGGALCPTCMKEYLSLTSPKKAEPEPVQEPIMTKTTTPSASAAAGIEGALGALIRDNVGSVVRTQLHEMGITTDSVKALICDVIAEKAIPHVTVRKNPDPADPPFKLVHMNYEAAKFWLDMGVSIYLNGPAGSGKTVAAQQLAEEYGRNCTIIPCHGEMTVYDLSGYRDGHGEFCPTPFYHAWQRGDVIVIDEVDKSPGEVNVFLNSATAQGVITFPNGETLEKQEQSHLIFTGNTKMSGADAAYSAGQRQDGSFSNRLVAIDWPFDANLELALAEQEAIAHGGTKLQGKSVLTKIQKIRSVLEDLGMTYIVGQRQTMMASAALAAGRSEDTVYAEVVYNWMDPRDAERVKEKL
jgi:hypothetical protein